MQCRIIYLQCQKILLVAILLIPLLVLAQDQKTVTGTVYDDEQNAPLPGTSVSVKGRAESVATNASGVYTIRVSPGDTLVFSHTGFLEQKIAVKNRTNIDVHMKKSASSLEEVVVVGYGATRKADLTGSVGQVNMKELSKAPVASFVDAMAGRVAGVQVSSDDGQPGSGMNIVIRGSNSLTQSNSPLYVIDGFPVEDPETSALSPNDIASINILKDASATAIYGARGANGVIVIETKKGGNRKPTVNFNGSFGVQKITKKIPVMSPYEYLKYQFEVDSANTRLNYFIDGKTMESYKNEEGANFIDNMLRTAPMQIYNMSVRGGNAQTIYSLSGSYYNQSGIVINSAYQRYQGRFSLEQTLSKKIKAGINVNYGNSHTSGQKIAAGDGELRQSSYLFFAGWSYRPVSGKDSVNLLDDPYDAQSTLQDVRLNPITALQNDYSHDYIKNLTGNAFLTYTITKDLTLKVTGAANSISIRADRFYNSKTYRGQDVPFNSKKVNATVGYTERQNLSNENTLTYNKTFGEHKINVVGGFSVQKNTFRNNSVSTQNIPNEILGMSGMDEGTPYLDVASTSENTLVSSFGRINYGFMNKYLLTGTFRADGSSKFSKGRNWGYFPSAAFAWKIIEEPFMESLDFLSDAKLRISYGATGNNRVSDFAYFTSLQLPIASSYSFNNATPSQGTIPDELGNMDLQWETTNQLDLGFDLGLFNERVQLAVDFYRKETRNLLLYADLPLTTGYTKAYENIGKIRNDGVEITLTTTNFRTNDFVWTSNFNISFNRNKVLELTRGQQTLFTIPAFNVSYKMPLYVAEVGKPAGMFYGHIYDGPYQYSDFDNPAPGKYILKAGVPGNGSARNVIQPGDAKYKDLNGDGTIDDFDRTVIGRGMPIHSGGFSNNLIYKNFELNFLLQWSYGNQVYNANRLMLEGNSTSRLYVNQYASYENRWTPENQTAENYRAGGQGPVTYNSRVVEDGSYLRLKTIALSYSLPSSITRKLKISGLAFNATAQNIYTISNYSGMDPEVSVNGTALTPGFDFSVYPRTFSMVFGVNLTF